MSTSGIKNYFTKDDYKGRWTYETGIIVLGCGMAGCCAAIEAHDLGEEVLMLDKAPEAHIGGGSRVSGQTLTAVSGDKHMLMEYQRNLNRPNSIPEDILEVWAEGMTTQREWISKLAEQVDQVYLATRSQLTEHPEFSGSEAVEGVGAIWKRGESPQPPPAPRVSARTWEAFWLNVKKRQIKVLFETPAKELIQDLVTGDIIGVLAEKYGKEIYIKARKAVILCTGGFEANEQMLRDYYGIADVYNFGSPYDTGDGIKMLIKVNADLWHMCNPTNTGGLWLAINAPGYGPIFRNISMQSGSWMEIAKDGRRFYNESFHWSNRHMHMDFHGGYIDSPHFQCLPVHLIFDEQTRKAGPIVNTWWGWAANINGCEWSDDNSIEVEKGWITKANTIRELATKLDKNPDVVKGEVDRFNRFCQAGEGDPEYGREAETMQPLNTPPYYGINIWPCLVATTGGGRRTSEAKVLDVDGNLIPRLYEAGELGSTLANLYQNGSFLTECIVFGRIAARNAAKETPWE